jgi:hypothetical protein
LVVDPYKYYKWFICGACFLAFLCGARGMSLIRWVGHVEDEDEESEPRRVQRWRPYLWSVCHPQCFYADRQEECDCKCGGKYHGVGRRSVSDERDSRAKDRDLLDQKTDLVGARQKKDHVAGKMFSNRKTLDQYARR